MQLRAATPGDAPALAELINFAGEGLPLHLWAGMAVPGETAWDVGRRRARRDAGGFSWRNSTVVEEAGTVVACLIGYPLPEAAPPLDLDQRGRVQVAEGRLRVAPSDGGHLVHHHGGVATQPVARVGADEDPEQGRLHGCISGTTSTPTTRHSCGPGCCRRCCTTTCGPISRGPGDNCCGPTACCPGPRRRSRLRCRSSLLTTSRPACVECGGWRVPGWFEARV